MLLNGILRSQWMVKLVIKYGAITMVQRILGARDWFC